LVGVGRCWPGMVKLRGSPCAAFNYIVDAFTTQPAWRIDSPASSYEVSPYLAVTAATA
jgi:hypothetical protein